MKTRPAILALADGSIFRGVGFGAEATRGGEVVFNTAHSGYQEVITDPSYTGQIVVMTMTQQGNYGVNEADNEAARPWVEGFVVRDLAASPSNHRAAGSLDDWLRAAGVPGISAVDTRGLTLRLRVQGAINGVVSTVEFDEEQLVEQARALPSMAGVDLVPRVASRAAARWDQPLPSDLADVFADYASRPRLSVVAIDCGMKRNILRNLVSIGCDVTIVPPTWNAAQIRNLRPAGAFVSNGPGDPAAVTYLQETLQDLAVDMPIFGICLGHQLLALALGARTYKLKFGHHGYNHPVKNLLTGRVEITSQNHGFAVEVESLKAIGLEPTHMNLYDQTNEGFRHRERPIFAVQYHPEAAPGPHDAAYLFACFREMIESRRPPTAEIMRAAQCRLARGRVAV